MVKRYKNGNINIAVTKDDRDYIKFQLNHRGLTYNNVQWRNYIFDFIINELDSVDTYIIGEPFCLGNDCMGYYVYCCNTNKIGIISSRDLDSVYEGKTLKIFMREPNDSEKELINLNYQ